MVLSGPGDAVKGIEDHMVFYGDRVKIRTYTGQKLMIWGRCSRLERAFNRVRTVTRIPMAVRKSPETARKARSGLL